MARKFNRMIPGDRNCISNLIIRGVKLEHLEGIFTSLVAHGPKQEINKLLSMSRRAPDCQVQRNINLHESAEYSVLPAPEGYTGSQIDVLWPVARTLSSRLTDFHRLLLRNRCQIRISIRSRRNGVLHDVRMTFLFHNVQKLIPWHSDIAKKLMHALAIPWVGMKKFERMRSSEGRSFGRHKEFGDSKKSGLFALFLKPNKQDTLPAPDQVGQFLRHLESLEIAYPTFSRIEPLLGETVGEALKALLVELLDAPSVDIGSWSKKIENTTGKSADFAHIECHEFGVKLRLRLESSEGFRLTNRNRLEAVFSRVSGGMVKARFSWRTGDQTILIRRNAGMAKFFSSKLQIQLSNYNTTPLYTEGKCSAELLHEADNQGKNEIVLFVT